MSAAAARQRKKQQKLAAPKQQSGGDDKSDDPVALRTDPRIRLNMKKQVEQLKTKPQWKSMPMETQAFLLETPPNSLNLHSFHRFWTSGKVVKFINQQFINPVSKIAPGDVMRDNCYSLALEYLNLKEVNAARALMLNGAFLHDSTRCKKNTKLTSFTYVFCEVKTPEAMSIFLQTKLKNSTKHPLSYESVTDVVGRIGADAIDGRHLAKCRGKSSSKTSPGVQIQLVLMDDAN
mmetsp:Transcript_58648/g.124459  ORF Transcript_58648/g.124459 Transcript_58648/m.124459 type:complete len:234 (-) Transcript_58648:2-703(-)